jgi:hypothetical protein
MSYRSMQPRDCNDLRTLLLFDALNDDQLGFLYDNAYIEVLDPGPVVAEGDHADALVVLMDGETVVSKRSGGA